MSTRSITSMAATAASIDSVYDRLIFCRTYARTHSADETQEFMRLTAELLPKNAQDASRMRRACPTTPRP